MIRFVSRAVAKWLLKHGAISVNEKELYEYGIYSFLFTLTPLFLVLMVSIPLNMAVEGVLLITPFILLRKFAGGFHFQTPLPCIIVSTVVLLGCLLEIRVILEYGSFIIHNLLVYASIVPICILSPIDSENRQLSAKEKSAFHRIAIVLATINAALYSLLLILRTVEIAIPLGTGMILTALLQLPCLFEHQKNSNRTR